MSNSIRRGYRFTGYVQGVGFRWRARTAAETYGLTGFVQNDWDGSVYLEAQGPSLAHDRLLASLFQGRYIQIDRVETKALPVVDSERSFSIRE